MSAYVETLSDVAFARFLRTRDTRTVVAERPAMPTERNARRTDWAAKPAPKFTARQMEIATVALANRTRNTDAAVVAGKS